MTARNPDPHHVRLAKRVAEQLNCSRSTAEQFIEGGFVSVDGQLEEAPGARVRPDQVVTVAPDASLLELTPVTLLLHKPVGFEAGLGLPQDAAAHGSRSQGAAQAITLLSAASHLPEDASGIRVLQRHFKQLNAAVPLENAASGLIVFTQDWRVARKLEEDMGSMEHEVIVEVQGEVSDQALRLLNRLQDSDADLPQTKVSLNSTGEGTSKLRFAIKGAHRGLIAHLCACAKLEIVAMRRIRLGRVALSDLPAGQWRYLAGHERF